LLAAAALREGWHVGGMLCGILKVDVAVQPKLGGE